MQKNKCKQCGKSFEAKRADSIYCSTSCKQQAHYKRASEKSTPIKEEKEMTEFYMNEFDGLDWENFDLITFCFLRKNLKGSVTQEEINGYINGIIWDEHNWKAKYDNVRRTKAFSDFQERFLSGEITVLTKKMESIA